jgi:hypothetical protein
MTGYDGYDGSTDLSPYALLYGCLRQTRQTRHAPSLRAGIAKRLTGATP